MAECKKCGLQYSSYCIGCKNVKHGLGLSDVEYEEYLKNQVIQKPKNVGEE